MSHHSQAALDSKIPGPTKFDLLAFAIADACVDFSLIQVGAPGYAEALARYNTATRMGCYARLLMNSPTKTRAEIAVAIADHELEFTRRFRAGSVLADESAALCEKARELKDLYHAFCELEAAGYLDA